MYHIHHYYQIILIRFYLKDKDNLLQIYVKSLLSQSITFLRRFFTKKEKIETLYYCEEEKNNSIPLQREIDLKKEEKQK